MSEIILICKKIKFFSTYDEDAFFEWLGKIKSITKISGIGEELYLQIKSNRISNEDVRELLAIFERYKANSKQLAVFINETNENWQKWKKLKIKQ